MFPRVDKYRKGILISDWYDANADRGRWKESGDGPRSRDCWIFELAFIVTLHLLYCGDQLSKHLEENWRFFNFDEAFTRLKEMRDYRKSYHTATLMTPETQAYVVAKCEHRVPFLAIMPDINGRTFSTLALDERCILFRLFYFAPRWKLIYNSIFTYTRRRLMTMEDYL